MTKGKKSDKKAKTTKVKPRLAKRPDDPILRLKLPASTVRRGTVTVSRLRTSALTQLSAGRKTADWDDWRSSVANETEQQSYSLSKGA